MASAKDKDIASMVLELVNHEDSHARSMFGGLGLYIDSAMFGLIADGDVYFKTDDENRDSFTKRDLPPFTFQKGSKPVTTSYYLLPETALDSTPAMTQWFGPSLEAAQRAAAKRKQKSGKSSRVRTKTKLAKKATTRK